MSASQKNQKNSTKPEKTSIAQYEQQILSTASIGVLITRINDGTILYANKAIANLLGMAGVDAIVGMPVPDFYWDPEDRKIVLTRFRTEGSVSNHDLRVRRADGSMIWVEISIQSFNFDGEQVLLSEITDISKRKQAEDALRESEERFHTLYDNATIGLYRTTPNGRILMINPTGLRLLGFDSFEELSRRNLEETGFEQEDSRKEFREKLERDGVIEQESAWTKKDGSFISVRESATIARDENGKILHYDGSFEDITEYKRAEQLLRQSEANLTSALLVAKMGYWEFDIATQTFLLNDQYYTLHGVTAEEAGGYQVDVQSFVKKFVHPEDSHIMAKATQRAVETTDPNFETQIETRILRKDGEAHWANVWFSIEKDKQGRTIKLRGVSQDITERKQADQALRESQQLLQLVMDNIPQAVFWKDRQNLNYLGANQSFAEDAGFTSPQELVGKSDFDMPWKEQAELYRADDRQVLELGYPKLNYEEPQTGPTGAVTWLRTSKIPMQDTNEQEFAVLGMYEDVTERKQLEQQVQQAFERRGYQVQVSTEISQEVAAASELSDLFGRVVTLTKERLGYYHAQLLRYDAVQDAVVLINGFGEIGQKMLAGGHQMPMGKGLIGTAAASGETVLRPNLADDLDWKPNPLLPETKGEIAVPIKWQDTVLGVLDVQSDQAGALTEDDRLLLEGLCGQIAIAMHNSELVETIRQNEARLAEALRTARLADWEYDVEKDLFTFNDQFYSIFNTTAEKAGGYQLPSARYAELFVHPDDVHIVGTEIGKALSSTERVYNATLDHRILHEDGSVGYIAVKVTVERDENGKITRYFGANQNITERKQAEEALRVNEARLAESLRMAKLAYWEHDLATNQFQFNDQFYAICHTTVEQEGGYTMSPERYTERFIHPDDRAMTSQAIAAGMQSTDRHFSSKYDQRLIYLDGSGIGHMSIETNIERDENGNIVRVYGSYQDITERKQAEDALAERLEEINRLYQNLSHEGWKTYRETADLPTGFIYDQTGTKPVEDNVLEGENFASIPMRVLGGEVVGTLSVADDPRKPTSPEDLAFMEQVSDQIALALEGARLAAQTQSALAQSEKLFDASRKLAQVSDLQELVKTTVEVFNIPILNGAELDMFSYDSAGELDSLAVVANWWNGAGKAPGAIGSRFPKAMFSAIKLFLTPTPVFISDALNSDRVDASMQRIIKTFNIRAVTFLPLFVGTHQIGVLVMHAEEPHSFTEEETRLFTGLGPQIATVLDNRRQFERAQQQAERESALNVISQKIQGATTVEAVLQIAARELGHALGAPMTIAQLNVKDQE